MRAWGFIVPLAFSSEFTLDEIVRIARTDCELTHPNLDALFFAESYALILSKLIRGTAPHDVYSQALTHALDSKCGPLNKIFALIESNKTDYNIYGTNYTINDLDTNMGVVFHAFQLILRVLKGWFNSNNFAQIMCEIASYGNDSDTNCAIVGPIVAACTDYKTIPYHWIKSLFECRSEYNKMYILSDPSFYVPLLSCV
jgi:ADP-ribosylglycohydrolase